MIYTSNFQKKWENTKNPLLPFKPIRFFWPNLQQNLGVHSQITHPLTESSLNSGLDLVQQVLINDFPHAETEWMHGHLHPFHTLTSWSPKLSIRLAVLGSTRWSGALWRCLWRCVLWPVWSLARPYGPVKNFTAGLRSNHKTRARTSVEQR